MRRLAGFMSPCAVRWIVVAHWLWDGYEAVLIADIYCSTGDNCSTGDVTVQWWNHIVRLFIMVVALRTLQRCSYCCEWVRLPYLRIAVMSQFYWLWGCVRMLWGDRDLMWVEGLGRIWLTLHQRRGCKMKYRCLGGDLKIILRVYASQNERPHKMKKNMGD